MVKAFHIIVMVHGCVCDPRQLEWELYAAGQCVNKADIRVDLVLGLLHYVLP